MCPTILPNPVFLPGITLGVRILDGPMTDSLEAMAFNMKDQVNDIYSCSWGPDDNGKTVDGPHQLAQVYYTLPVLYIIWLTKALRDL